MPIYEYKCDKCGVVEVMQGIKGKATQEMPELQEQSRTADFVDLLRAQGQRLVRDGLREKEPAAR